GRGGDNHPHYQYPREGPCGSRLFLERRDPYHRPLMAKRKGSSRRRRSSRKSLARVVDAPHLARLVPHLAPETLHQLIRHSGLHDCGELVASATPEQLTSVLDLDLW